MRESPARLLVADGEPLAAGQRLLELSGDATALVAAERTDAGLARLCPVNCPSSWRFGFIRNGCPSNAAARGGPSQSSKAGTPAWLASSRSSR